MNFNFKIPSALLLGALGLGFSTSSCAAQNSAKKGIPIRFSLPSDGFVTLVIEREDGVRVRNLISETPLKQGANTLFWDGLDDWGRDLEAAKAGRFEIPGKPVSPGNYRVRGLIRPQIDLKYEFSVYAPGNPPWLTKDTSGAWLANHTAPNAVLYVPPGEGRKFEGETVARAQILAGSYVAEGASGLAWLDAKTGEKLRGVKNLGGAWAGAPFLARDNGPNAVEGTYAYAASVWQTPGKEWELRVTKLTQKGETPVLTPTFKFRDDDSRRAVQLLRVSGIAAHNGLLAVSLPQSGVLWIDAARGEVLGKSTLSNPRGLVFDKRGDLLVLSGRKLLKFDVNFENPRLSNPKTLVENGLQDPQNLTLDGRGQIWVSDRGTSHQIKVFSPNGDLLHSIGEAGAPRVGTYNPRHLNNPAGLTLTPNGELWVAENDFFPKRVSVWTNAGELKNAFYGPALYGAGGTLDSRDKTRFYYKGMEFKLDWQRGESRLTNVFFRPELQKIPMPATVQGGGEPETAFYRNGQRYWTNAFTNSPTGGTNIAFLWRDEDGIAIPCAAMGNARDWPYLKQIGATLPEGNGEVLFAWSDKNGDAQISPMEVQFKFHAPTNDAQQGPVRGVTVMPDLSFLVAVFGIQTLQIKPEFGANGIPNYDLNNEKTLVNGAQKPVSSGGGQTLQSGEWTISTTANAPFAREGFSGAQNGKTLWSYPSLWPGLHASHRAPMPEFGGQVIGSTRLLGPTFSPVGSDAGAMWAINGDKGNIYVFTTDGLFVATLFQDNRLPSASWTMPEARRGMSLNQVTHGQEDFWPTISQTSDGEIYVVARVPAIVRVEGLERVRRLPEFSIQVGAGQIQKPPIVTNNEPRDKPKDGNLPNENAKTLVVPFGDDAPNVDGDLSDWRGAQWATIDERSKIRAALRVAGDQLFVAFQTGDANLLENSGAEPNNLFTTGGGLDLMIGATEGGSRLLISQVNGRARAMFYRPTVRGTQSAPVEFSSPQRTISFDRVDDVTKLVKFAGKNGDFEFSAPLKMLRLVPRNGKIVAGDVGILRGDGASTVQRIYWGNKATGLTSDLPSEAELTPQKWGNFKLEAR